MLKSSEARSIAHGMWGEVNGTYRTNTRGAFYFSCSGHGGFIVSAELLKNYPWVDKYVTKVSAIRYSNDTKSTLMHPYRRNSSRMSYNSTENVEWYAFEEDCDYAIAVMCGINLTKHPIKEGDARLTFYHNHHENNPKVAEYKRVQTLRENGDPDLIVSASGTWKTGVEGVTEVTTADRETHLVTGYDSAKDAYGNPYLSNCVAYQA